MAQMTCVEAQEAADVAWDTKVAPILQPYAEQFRASHDGYWQGLDSHSVIPVLGVTAFPDVGEACPTDQSGWPWPAAIRTLRLPMALRVNCYRGDRGPGYEVHMLIDCGTRRWERIMPFGAEMWRAVDWRAVSLLVDQP
jgi:hypothetical protein